MTTKRIILRFPQRLADKPIVFRLAKDYGLEFNILKADVTPDEAGKLILEVSGNKEDYEAGIKFIEESGINVEPLSKDVKRDDDICTECGLCVPICPSDSFIVDQSSRKIEFNETTCVVCGLCVKICPYRAMVITY